MSITSQSWKKRILAGLETCLLSAGLTAAILAVVYALRGIWPFGQDNVAYMDTAQFYTPGYYRMWDALHGGASWGPTWYSGLAEGYNYSMTELRYPYNWAFMLVDRGHVLEGLSLYLAIHLVIIDLIAAIAVSARFPRLDVPCRTALALVYTFCGYTLQYYSNFMWLNVVAVFPLMLLGLDRLLREGKPGLYTLGYIYFLHQGVYYSYMLTAFIVLYSLGWCYLVLPKRQRGSRLFNLGLCTALAYGTTITYWQSGAASIAQTARFQENVETGLETGMTTWNLTNTRHTFLMLLGLGLCFAALLLARRTRELGTPAQRERRRLGQRFFLYMAGVFALPMVFTNIDTAWHFGQYNFFPMRYGYMLCATVIGFAGAALEDRDLAETLPAPPRRRAAAAGCIAAVVLVLTEPVIISAFREYGACFLASMGRTRYLLYFAALVLAGAGTICLYYLILRASRRRVAAWAMVGLITAQLAVNASGLIAPSDDHTITHEYDPAYIGVSERLYDYFSAQDISPLSRSKNVDGCLSASYPDIAGTSALSSINSDNSSARLSAFRQLGYTVNYFRILDTGGTVFTDMLLGVDRVLSESELDPDLYAPGDTVAGVQIGACRYPGVIGLTFDPDAMETYYDQTTLADRLNVLYRAFTDSDNGTLAASPETEMTAEGGGMRTYTLTVTLDRPAFLYMRLDGMAMNITANGRDIAVPSYLNLDNRVYPAAFNSNLLSLGLFPAGRTDVRFTSAMDLTEGDIELTALDRQALDAFYEDGNLDPGMTVERLSTGFHITITVDKPGQYLFLPLSGWWTCTVNGVYTGFDAFLSSMVAVPLQKGENTVYVFRGAVPEGAYASTADDGEQEVSIAPAQTLDVNTVLRRTCLALAVLWAAANPLLRRRARPMPRLLGGLTQAAFLVVAAVVIGFLYVAPTVSLIRDGKIIWF